MKKILIVSLSVVALLGAASGIYLAVHSPLFLVQGVEITEQPADAPVDAQTLAQLAAVPPGVVNLFDLNLGTIETRLLSNPWVREVRLQKRFPQTLAVTVKYREPVALFQTPGGALAYVDSTGKAFGQVNLHIQPDLPLLSGFSREPQQRVREALKLISTWENSPAQRLAQISSLSWDPERGYRALITYSLGPKRDGLKSRAMVDLGQEIDAQFEGHLKRVSDVLNYLGKNSIPSHQIWADTEKKIVVKTARGS